MPEAGQQHSRLERDPNLIGLLSLQLLLLAFFILLVSISSFDAQRVRSVLDSVQAAFSDVPDPVDSNGETSRADAIVLAAIIDELEGVLATTLQLDRVERVGNGAVQLDMPVDALFAPGTAQLEPGRADLLKHLVAALDRRPAGYRYDLQALVGTPAASRTETGNAAAPSSIAVDRAGALARALLDSGAMPSGVAGGVLPGAPGRLRLVIELTDAPRPYGLFAQSGPEREGPAR